ncbi:MAG: hypothetical protein K2O45_17100 [Oscillospiraceae bacterium]|nr:hypothetical protein [Oscillospiraceae bacterium]
MKKTRKLAALFLAMLMAFSLLAVTAAAYDAEEHDHDCVVCCEDEGVVPMYDPKRCPRCGREAYYSEIPQPSGDIRIWVSCINSDCGYAGWL